MEFDLQVTRESTNSVDKHALLSFKFEDGVSFPASYIEFAKQYGYGVTCGEFLIYIPLKNNCDSFFNRSLAIKSTYEDVLGNADDVWFDLGPDVDFEKLQRLIPFAKSENGYYLFWDSKRFQIDEMDIYITDFSGLGFIKAANNLYEFIEKITSQEQFLKVFPRFVQKPLPATFMGYG